jgi:hypothetical protein
VRMEDEATIGQEEMTAIAVPANKVVGPPVTNQSLVLVKLNRRLSHARNLQDPSQK